MTEKEKKTGKTVPADISAQKSGQTETDGSHNGENTGHAGNTQNSGDNGNAPSVPEAEDNPVQPDGAGNGLKGSGFAAAENPPENAERPQDETENGAETDGTAHEPENITGVPGTETVPAPAAGTVPAIGEDMESTAENTGEAPPGRDREAEWKELAAAHPEIVGETLPEDIYRECMISELPPIRVYESMMMKKQADRIHALEAELAQLRQNAETAARAPVMGTANAPAPAEYDDPFLLGFNAYR